MKKIEQATVQAVQKVLTDGDHVVSGELYNSITAVAKEEGERFVIDIYGDKQGVFLDRGTRPHTPPIAPIRKWVQMKRSVPKIKGLEYAIQKHIAKHGTKKYSIIDKVQKDGIIKAVKTYLIEKIDI